MGINSSNSSITGMGTIINVTNRNRKQYTNRPVWIQDRCIEALWLLETRVRTRSGEDEDEDEDGWMTRNNRPATSSHGIAGS